jgi:hypothetical protein
MALTLPAITIWQPWAELILCGAKPYEFRGWPAPRRLWGQRIALHAGKRRPPRKELVDLLHGCELGKAGSFDKRQLGAAMDCLERMLRDMDSVTLGAIVGTATLGQPERCTALFGDRHEGEEVDPDKWGWPMQRVQRLAYPVPATGAQGWWEWKVPADMAGSLAP